MANMYSPTTKCPLPEAAGQVGAEADQLSERHGRRVCTIARSLWWAQIQQAVSVVIYGSREKSG